MLVESTIETADVSLAAPPVAKSPLVAGLRSGWFLGKLVLTGLLITYLVGWVQDFQRVRRLEAEPTPPPKITTKQEAWQRIYNHPVRQSVGTLPRRTSSAI